MGCRFLLHGGLPDLGIDTASLKAPALAGTFFFFFFPQALPGKERVVRSFIVMVQRGCDQFVGILQIG